MPRALRSTILIGAVLALGATAARAADPLPAALVAMHERSITDGECQTLPLLLANYPPVVAKVSATDTLYILPCDFGVINAPSRLYVVSTGAHAGILPLIFAAFDIDFGWIADDVLFNVVFDPKTVTLTAHEYFDPAGDCGYEGTWVWRDYAFAMSKYRFQGVCDHTHAYKDWPTVWQAGSAAEAPRPQIGTLPDFFQAPN
jgi:hypothetical protein